MRDEQMRALHDRLAASQARSEAILARVAEMRREQEAKPKAGYVVVFCDHAGAWHAISSYSEWYEARVTFGALVNTLIATDYYADCGPAQAKIVDTERDGYTDYASAPAEDEQ